jgi:hypothetical protein
VVKVCFQFEELVMPIQQKTGNKHSIRKIRRAIPSIIKNECLNMLKGLKTFKASTPDQPHLRVE